MRMYQPLVSVRLIVYNHEKYVAHSIESVLNQTYQNLELIIIDDASTDGSAEVVRQFSDSRIQFHVSECNNGVAKTASDCAKLASGKYTANLCSDDVWELDKLQKQVEFLEKHPEIDAVFTKVRFIDENNQCKTDNLGSYDTIFDQFNRSKEKWLNRFFYYGNCLCISSVMIRSHVYKELDYQDARLANLSDFDLWVRFCLKHDLNIIDETLTQFRLRDNSMNASASKPDTNVRDRFEFLQILNHFLELKTVERLLLVFPECINFGQPTQETIPFFLAMLALKSESNIHHFWAEKILFNYLSENQNAKLLKEQFNFGFPDFHKLSGNRDVFSILKMQELIDLQQQHNNLQLAFQTMQTNNRFLNNKIVNFQQTLEEIRNSTSWKLSAPIRKLTNIFGRSK